MMQPCIGCGQTSPSVVFVEGRRRCQQCRRTRAAFTIANPSADRFPRRDFMIAPMDHLLSHRSIDLKTGCWNWTGFRDEFGYGIVQQTIDDGAGRAFAAHRLAAHIFLGLDLNARYSFACHRCDNPACFNPAHLFIGTPQDNVADCVRKGRLKAPVGIKNLGGGGKLNDEKVREIRMRLLAGETQNSIAELFGVDQTMVSLIHRNKKWTHVEVAA